MFPKNKEDIERIGTIGYLVICVITWLFLAIFMTYDTFFIPYGHNLKAFRLDELPFKIKSPH